MLLFHCLVVRMGLHESSARRWLVQNFGWCDSRPQGAKTPNCRIGTRRVQCGGESATRSAIQGSAEKWRPSFRHFLRSWFTTLDVQDVRSTLPIISTSCPQGRPCKEFHARTPILGGLHFGDRACPLAGTPAKPLITTHSSFSGPATQSGAPSCPS